MKSLKVYLKFRTAQDGKNVGFVTKLPNNSWIGCWEDDCRPKMAVVVSTSLSTQIIKNVLYKCTLVPMKSKSGFVAVSATPVMFKANIEVVAKPNRYKICIKFGNKTIEYDPYSPNPRKNDLTNITLMLLNRYDIKDKKDVVSQFNETAMTMAEKYKTIPKTTNYADSGRKTSQSHLGKDCKRIGNDQPTSKENGRFVETIVGKAI